MLNQKDIGINFYDETNDKSALPYACMRAEFAEGKLLKNCPKQRSSLLSGEFLRSFPKFTVLFKALTNVKRA